MALALKLAARPARSCTQSRTPGPAHRACGLVRSPPRSHPRHPLTQNGLQPPLNLQSRYNGASAQAREGEIDVERYEPQPAAVGSLEGMADDRDDGILA